MALLVLLAPLVRRVHQAAPQAPQALLERLVQLGPLVLAQAAPQALQALAGSQELPVLLAPRARQALREIQELMAPLGPAELQA